MQIVYLGKIKKNKTKTKQNKKKNNKKKTMNLSSAELAQRAVTVYTADIQCEKRTVLSYANSEGSNQSAHLHSLIMAFSIRPSSRPCNIHKICKWATKALIRLHGMH